MKRPKNLKNPFYQSREKNIVSKKIEEFKRKAAQKRIAKNETFLTENAQKEGVIVLENGIQYEIVREGNGRVTPSAKDWVTTHYHGTLIDGKVFDSSVERGKPATFKLNNVIQGWQEVLPLMVVGDEWRVYIPADLAYGERQEGKIPSHSLLIFEINLLSIGK